MKALVRFALSIGAATVLAGCGQSQSQIGIGALSQSRVAPAYSDQRASWMSPGSSGGDLLYAASLSTIYAFTYPEAKFVGKLSLPEPGGGQLCSDASGDVFAPVGSSASSLSSAPPEILEYAHGGSQPIKILSGPNGSTPYACSVDSRTGNLAVTDFFNGAVDVYRNARGKPRTYVLPGFLNVDFCTFDDSGDLFVTGVGKHVLAVLRHGSTKFTYIVLENVPGVGLAGIQWDGSYITMGRAFKNTIYRIKIQGNKGSIVGVSHLKGAWKTSYAYQYSIRGNEVIKPTGKWSDELGLWDYPAGGAPIKLIKRFAKEGVFSATVSAGTSR